MVRARGRGAAHGRERRGAAAAEEDRPARRADPVLPSARHGARLHHAGRQVVGGARRDRGPTPGSRCPHRQGRSRRGRLHPALTVPRSRRAVARHSGKPRAPQRAREGPGFDRSIEEPEARRRARQGEGRAHPRRARDAVVLPPGVWRRDRVSTWTPARGWLHGALNTQMDLSGTGGSPELIKRTLTAIGTALVSNGKLGPGPALEAVANTVGVPSFKEVRFHDLKLPFRVEQGRMITDPVTLEGKTGKWQLVGGIGFDGRLDYAVSVTLAPEIVSELHAKSALAAGALTDSKGNLIVDLKVDGPAAAPRVRIDTNAIRDRLLGKVSDALADQRQKLHQEVQTGLEEKQKAATDSARKAVDLQRRALEDSLKRKAQDLLKGLFGGGKKDTAK
ncbi:MAG: hypothetical protein E6K80_01880 [Candidatus Eisenbacteria bacterium]|uniref:Uncharacterized protein n=1 Tax=Eiseniibacteriota bacterium TaxID=2212470 RepID=A0A538UA77_UNCEI|nr:MAG: hypothetical protein E6K80_01880 [Candidatus Eisenbacteria bacterium]